jgi:tRNA nucleotidyltransferase/poly(A) polymerase
MRKNANLIKEISGERILGEFDKILYKHGSTKIAFDLIERSDLDKALFGQKFDKNTFEFLDNLGVVSFYYVLGAMGGKIPWKFYKERLKGEAPIVKSLITLEKYFEKFNKDNSELENKWHVFQMLKTSPMLVDVEILPPIVSEIIDDMKAKKIPMKMGDIPVNGNDIMDKFGVKNEEVGNIMNKMYQDALMNTFDWKNKEKTLKYLERI